MHTSLKLRTLAALSLLAFTNLPLTAQPGWTDFSFDTWPGIEIKEIQELPTVNAITVQGGKILIGGKFNSVDGSTRFNIARLNQDGLLDSSFENTTVNRAGPDTAVFQIGLQQNGAILIAGNFKWINGLPRHGLARLSANGGLDTGFSPQVSEIVTAIAIQADQKILVAGQHWQGSDWQYPFFRLNSDGSEDRSFQFSNLGIIKIIIIQNDDSIFIGGILQTPDKREGVVKIKANGQIDPSFISPLTNAVVNTLAIQPDGKLVIGGWFYNLLPSRHCSLVRLNADGSMDKSFQLLDANGPISAVSLDFNRRIVIVGDFKTIDGEERNGIARLNESGNLDRGFGQFMGGASGLPFESELGYTPRVKSLCMQDKKIIIGGTFTRMNGIPRGCIARLLNEVFDPKPSPVNMVVKLLGKSCMVEISGVRGSRYQIQRATNLWDWNDWVLVQTTDAPIQIFDPESINSSARFYRGICVE